MSYVIAQNQQGPLPRTFPFQVPVTGDVTLAVAGTCWSNAAGALAGIIIYLDGNAVGKVPLFFNAASQHMTLQTFFVPIDLGDGPHTITIEPMTSNTVTDQNDYFSLWIID